jgi:hypothetical protein
MIMVENFHVALELIDLNSKIQHEYGKNSYKYLIPNATRGGYFISKYSFDQINFNLDSLMPMLNSEELGLAYEWVPLPRRLQNIYATELSFIRVINSDEDKDDFTQEKYILNQFILQYRQITEDINIKIPSENFSSLDFTFTSEFQVFEFNLNKNVISQILNLGGIKITQSSKAFNLDTRQFRKSARIINDIISTTATLQNRLAESEPLDDFSLVLNKSREDIEIHDNYRLAILELFIFCETFIVEILKQIKISKGITNKKIKNIDIPISYLLNIELPLVLNEFDESWKTVINNIDLVRSIRNKIVHDNYKPTRDEAINSANYVRAFVGKVKTEFPKLN